MTAVVGAAEAAVGEGRLTVCSVMAGPGEAGTVFSRV